MKKEVTYKSHDQITTIHATIWIPTIPIKGIVQISHGMIECMTKYEEIANILNQEGYIVCGEDHLGHGKSTIDRQHRGYIAKKNGAKILVEDAHTLTRIIKKEYPGLQLFMLGFSFGSFITRNYIGMYGDELSGVIIMGSTVMSTAILNLAIFNGYLQSYFTGGQLGHSRALQNMTIGKFPKYFANNQFKLCWVSKDYKALDRYYRNNPYTDFQFKNNGFITMFKSMKMNNKRKILKGIPKDLPILILSGKDDPATHFAKDVIKLEKKYNRLHLTSVKGRYYNEARHDLLLEKEKDIILNEIVRFIKLKADPSIKPVLPPKVIKTVTIKTVKANFNNITSAPKVEEEKPIETPVIEETKEVIETPVVEQTPDVVTPVQEHTEGKKKKKKKKHQNDVQPEIKEEVKVTEEVTEEPKKDKKKKEVQPSINFDEEPKKEDKVQPSINFDEEPKEEKKETPQEQPKKDKKRKKKNKQPTQEDIMNEKINNIQNEDGIFDEIGFEDFMNETDKK